MLDLGDIGAPRTRWIPLSGALQGVEVEIRYVGPRDQEKFRQQLVRDGVLRIKDGTHVINNGRDGDFFKSFAKMYVTDWRGEIKPEGTEYDAEKMGLVLGAYNVAFNQVSEAVGEETDFFPVNGNG